jgi:hypothetical protein
MEMKKQAAEETKDDLMLKDNTIFDVGFGLRRVKQRAPMVYEELSKDRERLLKFTQEYRPDSGTCNAFSYLAWAARFQKDTTLPKCLRSWDR